MERDLQNMLVRYYILEQFSSNHERDSLIQNVQKAAETILFSVLCKYQLDRLPSPRADPQATNFFRQNPHPGDSFSVQNAGPRVEKNETKSPPPGIICLVRMPRYQ